MEFKDVFEQVVVSATKDAVDVRLAPATVDIVTADDIRRWGFRSVADALASLAGIYVIDDYVDRNVGVRGSVATYEAASDILKVMVNGQPVSFRANSGNFFGDDLIPIDMVKRIEVVRGPASALYGANAFLGVVNVVTFNGSERLLVDISQVSSRASADGYWTTRNHKANGVMSLMTQGRTVDSNFALGGTFHYADRSGLQIPGLADIRRAQAHNESPATTPPANNYPTPAWSWGDRFEMLQNNRSRNDLARTASLYGTASVSQPFNLPGATSLDGHWQYSDRFGEFAGTSFLTHANRITSVNGFVRAKHELVPTGAGVLWSATLAFASGGPTAADHAVDVVNDAVFMKRRFGYRATDVGIEGGWKNESGDSLRLGIDYSYDVEQLLYARLVSVADGTTIDQGTAERKNFENTGVYLQAYWQPPVVSNLKITAGSRLDHNNIVPCDTEIWNCLGGEGFASLSNRLGIVYQLAAWNAVVKALYGSSFKPPSPFQLYHEKVRMRDTRGNPDLLPQTADTVELVLGLRPFPMLDVEVSGYHTAIQNMVMFFKEHDALIPRNLQTRTMGLEGKATYVLGDRAVAKVAAGWVARARFVPVRRSDETAMLWRLSPYSTTLDGARKYPRLKMEARLHWRFPEWFAAVGVGVRYASERLASFDNSTMFDAFDLDHTYSLPRYVESDVTLTSEGLRLFGEEESVMSLAVHGIGNHVNEPGHGGLDIPTLGFRVLLRWSQDF